MARQALKVCCFREKDPQCSVTATRHLTLVLRWIGLEHSPLSLGNLWKLVGLPRETDSLAWGEAQASVFLKAFQVNLK